MPTERLNRPKLVLWVGGLTLLLGLLVTAFSAWWRFEANQNEAQRHLDTMALEVTDRIKERMARYEYGLRGGRGAVVANPNRITRQDFKAYSLTRDLPIEFPGAHGFGLIYRVPKQDQARFERAARTDDWPSFAVRQLEPHDGDRFVIQYIEPIEPNRAAVGLDVASEPNRREAALQSAQTGRATLTAPITLVQASGLTMRSFLLMLPVYNTDQPSQLAEERLSQTIAWSYAPLVTDDVLKGLIRNPQHFTLTLQDKGSPEHQPFFQMAEGGVSPDVLPEKRMELPIFGRTWVATVTATPQFMASLRLQSPIQVGLTAGLITVLLAAVATMLAQLREKSRRQRLDQARRASVVESSDDAIISLTLDGQITDWNDGAERLFGYSGTEAIGQFVKFLLLPPELEAEESALAAAAVAGERRSPLETKRRHRSGELIDVSITTAPIRGEHGTCVGYTKFLRDVRQSIEDRSRLASLNASLEALVLERTEQLRATSHDLRAVLDAVPSMIGYWDHDLVNRMANQAYAKWFGVDHEQLPGRTMSSLLGATLFEKNRVHIEAALRGEAQTFERSIPRPDGQGNRHSLAHYLPDIVDGQVRGFYVLVHDVSELVESRQALARSLEENDKLLLRAELARKETETAHRFLRQVTDKLPLSIAYLDQELRYRFVNSAFCRQLGLDKKDLLGHAASDVDSANGRELAERFADGIASQGLTFESSVEQRIQEVRLVPDLDEDHRTNGLFSIGTDITERKAFENNLKRTLTLLNSVLATSTQVAIVAVDPGGMINLFNRGAENMLGYRAEDVVGRLPGRVLLDKEQLSKRATELGKRLGRTVRGAYVLTEAEYLNRPMEWNYVHKDGHKVPVSLGMTAITDNAGVLLGYLAVAHDISERKKYEASLRHAVQKSEAANLAKSRFLANMSHDIRTPMNAVIGLTHVLEKTRLDANQADLLQKMKLSSQSLLNLLNDVLDLSKIEAEEMHLERRPFALCDLLKKVENLFRVQAETKRLGLDLVLSDDVPCHVRGDETRLQQILHNLLGNAIKFTDHGTVRLSAKVLRKDGMRALLQFSVKDTGIGIESDVLPRLFAPFVQADSTTTRRFGGTGLGLSIVKELVTMMGGQVHVTSTPHGGSEFTVELEMPLCMPGEVSDNAATGGDSGSADIRNVRVLVADDSKINLEVARRILEHEGAIVTLVDNGQQAVDALANPDARFDLVLMDVQMPVLDGCDATRRIRSGLGFQALPIVALTAGNTTSERSRAQASGMDDVLAKPFDPDHLVQIMGKHLKRHIAARTDQTNHGDAWPSLEGIDIPVVRNRLKGDLALFRTLLRNLMDELSSLFNKQAVDGPTPALAAQLHSLKGCAGTLGADALYSVTARAETACLTQDVASFPSVLRELREEQSRLQSLVSGFLNVQERWEDSAEPMDPKSLSHLLDQLRSADLSAIESFKSLAPQLRHKLGPSSFERVRQHIDNLEFSEVAQALATC